MATDGQFFSYNFNIHNLEAMILNLILMCTFLDHFVVYVFARFVHCFECSA